MGLDGQAMDRYAVRSSETVDVILVSADPSVIDSKKRIRSWLMWESTKYDQSGSMTFGDSTKEDVDWINAVATSIEFQPVVETNDVTAQEFSTMADDEILKMVKTEGPKAAGK